MAQGGHGRNDRLQLSVFTCLSTRTRTRPKRAHRTARGPAIGLFFEPAGVAGVETTARDGRWSPARSCLSSSRSRRVVCGGPAAVLDVRFAVSGNRRRHSAASSRVCRRSFRPAPRYWVTTKPAVQYIARSDALFGGAVPAELPDLFVEWAEAGHFMERVVHPRVELRQMPLCRKTV